MENGLVWVKFKSGKLRELSHHIAYDIQHQKTMGFTPVDENSAVVIEEPKKKMLESHVVEALNLGGYEFDDLAEVADLDSPPMEAEIIPERKKRGRKPKQQ